MYSQQVRLGDICRFVNGGTPSTKESKYWNGNIPWITSADIVGAIVTKARSYITPEAIERSATNKIPKGTILLVTRTSVGKVALAGFDLCISQDITGIFPEPDKLHLNYLAHFLHSKQTYFTNYQRGATIKGITREVVENLAIPLPPLDEQRRIAAVLDKADALREKRRRAIAQLDELLKSVFLEMFGDPVTNPKGWEKTTFGSECKEKGAIVDGPFGSTLKPDCYVDSGVRVIRNFNINDDSFDASEFKFITIEKFEEVKRSEVRLGDILVSTKGTIGNTCLMPELST